MILLVLFELMLWHSITIYDVSISEALAEYAPYNTILIPTFVGATTMFAVTMMRNIQIGVYFRRKSAYSVFMRTMNFLSTLVNITAYVGFVLLVFFKMGGGGQEQEIHYIGSVMYFTCSGVYAILNSILLLQQAQYPLAMRVFSMLLAAAGVVATSLYGAFRDWVEFEWMAVAIAALYIMLFSVLFHIDQVDDEIAAFFCCRKSPTTSVVDSRVAPTRRKNTKPVAV